MTEKKAVEISAASKDPKKKPEPAGGKKDAPKADTISDEDLQIRSEVELLVTRIGDQNAQLVATALARLTELLRSASGSVASVPKPLKFVRPLYTTLVAHQAAMMDEVNKKKLNDVLSLIAMTMPETKDNVRASLKHKLAGNTDDLKSWGHEYLRFLSGELAKEWDWAETEGHSTTHLEPMVRQIVTYMLEHQDEPSGIDLLMEVDAADQLEHYVNSSNYARICQYLIGLSRYLTAPASGDALRVAFACLLKAEAFPDALRVALALREKPLVQKVFDQCSDVHIKVQLALVCARYRLFLDHDDETLAEINGNSRLSEWYRGVAKELDALTPKSPDDIYKNHLVDARLMPSAANSHMHNLASTFVSAFVNAGFGKDTLVTEQGTTWLYQTKDHRMFSAAASLGLIHLWDHEEGLPAVDKYSYSEEQSIKGGSYLALGLTMCGVKSAFDPALGLLSDHVNSAQREVRLGAILGLGYAYAGTQRDEVKELLVPFVADSDQPLEIQCFASFALALVFAGSKDEDISEAMVSCLMEKDEKQVAEPCLRFLILALGSLFLGQQEAADSLLDAVLTLPESIRRYTHVVVQSCAYAATGNVLIVQKLFNIIAEIDEEEEDAAKPAAAPAAAAGGDGDAIPPAEGAAAAAPAAPADDPSKFILNYKAAAVLGIGLVALGEEIGAEMAKRALLHILLADTVKKTAGTMSGRKALPLAYALLSASNPDMTLVETLSRLTHDGDVGTAQNAILSLGLVAAGSNNARVATMLRNLSGYYHREKDADVLFTVRIAQGLCSMGKGHLTLTPLQQDRLLVSPTALMGLLGLVHSALDLEKTILDKYHFMLFSITPSLNPRMLLAVDKQLKPVDKGVIVRVGIPVDTVALPGKPKTITGFQTVATPILMNDTDRAEVASGKHKALTSHIEGIFIVEEKPQVAE